ncbi:MAG: alpha/beta hydrolase [Brevibacillus sp.]|nr:alpha/beta hydrolase [Brevibacillus sp.]
MECKLSDMTVYCEEYGSGRPIVMLHGFSLDHNVMTGCMEPLFVHRPGWRRIYLDLPGMGRTRAADWITSSDDMLSVVLKVIEELLPGQPYLLVGESYGGYLARGILAKQMDRVDGIALICPMIVAERTERDLPAHTVLVKDVELLAQLSRQEAEEFASVAVIQDKPHWERFKREILPGVNCADQQVLQRIKQRYAFSFDPDHLPVPFPKPALFLMGRQDSFVGYRDAWKLIEQYPRATYAVLDRAGHNMQIEQSRLFQTLVCEWLDRVAQWPERQP